MICSRCGAELEAGRNADACDDCLDAVFAWSHMRNALMAIENCNWSPDWDQITREEES